MLENKFAKVVTIQSTKILPLEINLLYGSLCLISAYLIHLMQICQTSSIDAEKLLNQVHAGLPHLISYNSFCLRMSVCAYVSAPEAINN